MISVEIRNSSEIPQEWGPLKKVVKKTTVGIREPRGEETFTLKWGQLTAIPGTDIVIVASAEDEYPCKITVFQETYREVSEGRYQKMAVTEIVQVPEGATVTLHTLEGIVTVTHPDYVAVGKEGEVYANGSQWVKDNLDFVE